MGQRDPERAVEPEAAAGQKWRRSFIVPTGHAEMPTNRCAEAGSVGLLEQPSASHILRLMSAYLSSQMDGFSDFLPVMILLSDLQPTNRKKFQPTTCMCA